MGSDTFKSHSRQNSLVEKIQKAQNKPVRRKALLIVIILLVLLWQFAPWTADNHTATPSLHKRSRGESLKVAFYTIPKPFAKARSQQERAIASWSFLPLQVDINLVLSSDSDIQDFQGVASKYGANLVNVRLDPEGNVLQDELFTAASRNSDVDIVVIINSDIVLFNDFAASLRLVDKEFPGPFFYVAARRDLILKDDLDGPESFTQEYFKTLAESELAANAILHSYGGVDFYAWRPKGDPYVAAIGGAIPPFTYGRGKADNWVVKQAENNGVPVIDGSLAVKCLHFAHGYAKDDSKKETAVLSGGDSGQVVYQNHWFLAQGMAVSMNKFSFFEFGNVKLQEGVPWASNWRLSSCFSQGREEPCLQHRIGSACDCEYNPFVKNTLSPVVIDGSAKICGRISPPRSLVHPTEAEGALLLSHWRAKDNDLIVLGFNSEYMDMLRSTICRFRQLGIDNYIAVAFNAEALKLCRAEALPCVAGYSEEHAATETGAAFGSREFRSLTKLKSKRVLQFLEAGFNVLWSDIDIFWFENVLPALKQSQFQDYDVLIQSNAPMEEAAENGYRRINSGFYYVKSNPRSIKAFSQIVDHAMASRLSEQPSFYTILCSDDMLYVKGDKECINTELNLKTYFLPRSDYPNGNTTLWNSVSFPTNYPPNLKILHNNWIAGHDAKVNRFKSAGFFQSGTDGCLGF